MRIMGVRLRMRLMPFSSLATAASTSVMMLPGPMAFTRTPCGAIASDIDLTNSSDRHDNADALAMLRAHCWSQCFPGQRSRICTAFMLVGHPAAPCEVVDAAFGGVVAGNGRDGGDAVDGRHVDDGTAAALADTVLLLHLPPNRLAALHMHDSKL